MRKIIAKSTLIAAAMLFAASSGAWSYSYLGALNGGDMVVGTGLRSYSMGGAGIGGSDEPATLLYNPATMNYLEQRQLALGFAYNPMTERVVTGDKRVYYNEPASFGINNFAVVVPAQNNRFAFGFAYAPAYDSNYSHKQILYSPSAPATRIGYREFVSAGTINSMTPAVSMKLSEKFAVGFSYNMISGAQSYSRREIDTSGVTDIIVLSSEAAVTTTGSRLDFGVIFTGLNPLRIGLTYFGAASLTQKTASAESQVEMPSYVGLGVAWDFGGRYNTKLAFDLLPMPLTAVKFNKAPAGWDDITVLKIGFEHWVREDVPFRLGFYSLPFYAEKKIELTAFTFGSAYKLSDGISLDFTGEYGKRNFIGDSNYFDSKTTIDETFKKLAFGANYRW